MEMEHIIIWITGLIIGAIFGAGFMISDQYFPYNLPLIVSGGLLFGWNIIPAYISLFIIFRWRKNE